jgi:hypothetical protein
MIEGFNSSNTQHISVHKDTIAAQFRQEQDLFGIKLIKSNFKYDDSIVLDHFYLKMMKKEPKLYYWLTSLCESYEKDVIKSDTVSIMRVLDHQVVDHIFSQINPELLDLCKMLFVGENTEHFRKEVLRAYYGDVSKNYANETVEYFDGMLYKGDVVLLESDNVLDHYSYVKEYYPKALYHVSKQLQCDYVKIRDGCFDFSDTVNRFLVWRTYKFVEEDSCIKWLSDFLEPGDLLYVYGSLCLNLEFFYNVRIVNGLQQAEGGVLFVDFTNVSKKEIDRFISQAEELDITLICCLSVGNFYGVQGVFLNYLSPGLFVCWVCSGWDFVQLPDLNLYLDSKNVSHCKHVRWDKLENYLDKFMLCKTVTTVMKKKKREIGFKGKEDFRFLVRQRRIRDIMTDPTFQFKFVKFKLDLQITTDKLIDIVPYVCHPELSVNAAYSHARNNGYELFFEGQWCIKKKKTPPGAGPVGDPKK